MIIPENHFINYMKIIPATIANTPDSNMIPQVTLISFTAD